MNSGMRLTTSGMTLSCLYKRPVELNKPCRLLSSPKDDTNRPSHAAGLCLVRAEGSPRALTPNLVMRWKAGGGVYESIEDALPRRGKVSDRGDSGVNTGMFVVDYAGLR